MHHGLRGGWTPLTVGKYIDWTASLVGPEGNLGTTCTILGYSSEF